jgi:hypothetical protein
LDVSQGIQGQDLTDDNNIYECKKEEDDTQNNCDVEEQSFDSTTDVEARAAIVAPTT